MQVIKIVHNVDMNKETKAAKSIALIDDDLLIHATWSMVAKGRGETLHCFLTEEEFQNAQISLDTFVYVDYHLGDNYGTNIVKTLSKQGYKHLYITTGDEKATIPFLPEIHDILGKDYPD